MSFLPQAFNPRWLLILVVTAAIWLGLALLGAYINTSQPPTMETLKGATIAIGGIVAVPSLFGFFGARLGFTLAHVGLLVGWILMIRDFGRPTQGFEDLAAVARFIMFGVIGLGVGTVADIIRYFVARKSGPSSAP